MSPTAAFSLSSTAGKSWLTGRFEAMRCPCDILLDTVDPAIAAEQLKAASQEAHRIEMKYSRYRESNALHEINRRAGETVKVDEETAGLLDYAADCFELSDGLFDITTGILRKLWRFEGTDHKVQTDAVERLRAHVGWEHVSWKRPYFKMPLGFELDFGGICKEYAADRILALLRQRHAISTLVNLGGDISAAGHRPWAVGIEDPSHPGTIGHTFSLRSGGVATSGTTKRFTKVEGQVLGHILNPKTGWPVRQAPQSVTVAAQTCTEAGFWSTMGILQGLHAETFLSEQALEFWCSRAIGNF